ncbi:bifunctional metallophosphatase/5'-nucleotidase [Shewanella ulleungensis]|uniref:Bifunctional metallophosphatase/5'-nucleotidase n=1 Tax=Shewanella ulleungensis TaxID=2282699 RepID=A0ABQ2QHI7_9GAMM|nr:bifunctional metallophosphatase/5'-nucleotidase [Shewanella ulleungensis]MCL1149761.1 bifunctional metallophosphatase/5'-nucleotidase [Shewanella ulleungensis]GGP81225.1 bifunctional metallophosphatase/5'-nucleotidase [Shewanella ulleungensis]
MQKSYRLSIAHINDTHSNFEPSPVQFTLTANQQSYKLEGHSGGYARLGFQIDQARQQAASEQCPFLFLHGGDSFQGTLYFREFQGAANAHLLNLLKPDAMVLGNHEIDAGNSPVQAFLNRIDFPVLAGNMDLSQEDRLKDGRLYGHPMLYDFDDSSETAKVLIKPFHDTKMAIIGITLDQMRLIARPDPDTHFVNAIDTTRATIARLTRQGIKHIIVLSHLGLDQDRELAEHVDGISLIIGGHSHTLQGSMSDIGLSDIPYAETINDTPILHAGKYAETLGLAEIVFNQQGRVTQLIGNNYFMLDDNINVTQADGTAVDNSVSMQLITQLFSHSSIKDAQHDEQIHQVIHTQYRPSLDALENQILAHIPRDFVHTRLPSKHLPHGSEIAPWVSRSMYKAAKLIEPNIDFALHNAGGVRQSLNKGQLSLADVVGRILPFELPLTLYQIMGKYVIEALESAINSATNNGIMGTGAGSFPYPYGLRYFYDGKQVKGQRITQIEIYKQDAWQPLEANKLYIGVSSAYTAAGKEGYDALLHAHWQQPIEQQTLPEAFIDFVSQHGHLIGGQLFANVHYISHRE